MKNMLILVVKNSELTEELFQTLANKGYNATVLIAKSLKHILENDRYDDDRMFLNVNHFSHTSFNDSSFSYFILDDKDLEIVKNIIRQETNEFKTVKGGMYSYAIPNFEGTI